MYSFDKNNIIFSIHSNDKLFIVEISKRLYKMHLNNPKVFNTKWLLKNTTIHLFYNK